VRKLTKAERAARDALPQTDSQQHARRPHPGQERPFSSNVSDVASPVAALDYKATLDVTMFAGHSTREAQPRCRWLMLGDIALASAIEKHVSSGKTTSSDFDKLRARLNNRCVEFLQVDLDLGLTMAQIACCAYDGSEKRERNRRNARQAYNAVLRFREKVVTTTEQSRQLSQKVKLLHKALVDLGERLQSLPMVA
jgi:hypothetical protein